MSTATIAIIVVAVVALFVLTAVIGSLYRKVGPNRALIIAGRGGTKVVVGGGTVVMPLFQRVDEFPLELMSFDVAPGYDLFTNQGVAVRIEAIAQLKVEGSQDKILRAAGQFLSKPESDREMLIRSVMEGHLRGIVGQLTVEQLVKDPELVSARMRETVAGDLDSLGLEVISFTLKDVSDNSDYIKNMSRPEVAKNKQIAEIAEAESTRVVAEKKAEAELAAAQAQASAKQRRVEAEATSEAAQAAAQRDLAVKKAEYNSTVNTQQAQADKAYALQESITQQHLIKEQTQVTVIQKQQEVEVQRAEADRRAAELSATIQRQAEAEAERTRIDAQAARQRAEIQADGEAKAIRLRADADAAAIRARGEAEADAIRLRGLAEAEALKARGLAEAEARRAQVEALNLQGQTALADTALRLLPQVAQALAESYGKVGSVTYIGSGGNGDGATSRVVNDVLGQVPMMAAIFESITGIRIRELVGTRLDGQPHDDAQARTDPRAIADREAAEAAPRATANGNTPVLVDGAAEVAGTDAAG